MEPLRLYWRPGAASMAPHAALAEIGVEYELVRIEREAAQADAGYRALNPLGVVPTLVDGDLVLTESAAILLYLADRYPQARLAPQDRAQFYRWLVFMTNTLQTAFLRLFYPERYGGGDEVRRAAAAEAQGHFDLIERSLDGRDWLIGEHRTAADLFLFMLTRWGRRLEPPAWNRPLSARTFRGRSRCRECAAWSRSSRSRCPTGRNRPSRTRAVESLRA